MRHLFYFVLCFGSFVGSAQNSYTVISNTNVIDVRTGAVLKDASILIKDNIIQEVSPTKKIKLPAGATVVDGTGKFVIPGMTDAHIHFFQSGGLYTRPDAFNFTNVVPYEKEREFTFNNTEDYLRRYLRMGITTVADVGGPMSNFTIRDSVIKKFVSPTVLVTGPLFSMVDNKPLDNGDAPIIKTTTIADADALFDKLLPMKPDYIKIWYIATPQLPADQTFPVVQHIAKRTHEAKLKLAVHATELKTAELAVDAGADILVHSIDDEVVTDRFIQKLVAKKVSYIPTLIVGSGYLNTAIGKHPDHPNDLAFANPFAYSSLRDMEHIPESQLPPRVKRVRAMKTPPSTRRADSVMRINLKKIYAAGVNVVAGTDAGNVGTMHASSFIAELEAMKQAGLTNAQLLKTATVNSALCFNQSNGEVIRGKGADLVVLNQNPLEDISYLNSAAYVIKSGQVIKADTLIIESPEMLVQRQVNAYNARNLDAFLATYVDDVQLYNFPDSLVGKGKEQMIKVYGEMFKKLAYLHCEIVNRIKLNNTIIDHERVKFNEKVVDAVAIYEVKDGKIVKVTFKN
jgi:imidazolonepropionase-like amidohydrolase